MTFMQIAESISVGISFFRPCMDPDQETIVQEYVARLSDGDMA